VSESDAGDPPKHSSVKQSSANQTPLLRDSGFLTLWLLGGLNSTGRWLEMLVIAIFVLDATGSPLQVAAMLMLRLLPMALFGAFGGVFAQRFRRLSILRWASLIIVGFALLLSWLAAQGLLQVWHVGLGSFVSGLAWSTDFPVRRTLMGDIAGPERVSRAMSLDILAGASTRTLGPLIGGLLYASIGIEGAFLLAAGLYSIGGVLLLLRREFVINARTDAADASPQTVVESLRAGWRVLGQSRTLPGILAVTVVFNLWGFPFVSMVPVFGREVLALDPAGIGWLVSGEGAGALLGAIALSMFARSSQARYLYVYSVIVYCVFALLFSQAAGVVLAGVLLVLVGFVSAAFGAMQSALVLMNAPEGFERQMMGVLSVAIGTAPLGFLHIGAMADAFGVTTACTVVAIEGLLAMGWVLWRWPRLLAPQPL